MKGLKILLLLFLLSIISFSDTSENGKETLLNITKVSNSDNGNKLNLYAEETQSLNYINQNLRLNSDAQKDLLRFTLGEGYLNFNENIWMTYRLRQFIDLDNDRGSSFEGNDLRFRLYYNVGIIGEGVEAHHRLEYRTITDVYDRVKWNYEINFAKKLKMETPGEYFVIRPLLGWASNKVNTQGDSYDSVLTGLEWLVSYNLWQDWYFQFNAYAQYHINTGNKYKDRYNVDNTAVLSIEAYLLNETKLADLGRNTSLNFYFEGGVDPANFYAKKHEFMTPLGEDSFKQQYSLYAMPELNIKHLLNNGFILKSAIGLESRNQKGSDKISDYNNQIYFSLGWETKF